MSNKERPYHPADVGLTWAYLSRHSEGERKRLDSLQFNQRGRLRFGQRLAIILGGLLALGAVAVSPAGPAVADFIRGQVNEIIAEDNEVFRQTSQMYQTEEFKASIDRNLGK